MKSWKVRKKDLINIRKYYDDVEKAIDSKSNIPVYDNVCGILQYKYDDEVVEAATLKIESISNPFDENWMRRIYKDRISRFVELINLEQFPRIHVIEFFSQYDGLKFVLSHTSGYTTNQQILCAYKLAEKHEIPAWVGKSYSFCHIREDGSTAIHCRPLSHRLAVEFALFTSDFEIPVLQDYPDLLEMVKKNPVLLDQYELKLKHEQPAPSFLQN